MYCYAYHVQDGRSALSQAEGTQAGRSQYPYQIHLVRHYGRLPIRDEVRHALLPNGRSRHHCHLVHLVLDYGVHVVLRYAQHVPLVLYRRSALLVIVTCRTTNLFMAGPGAGRPPASPYSVSMIPSPNDWCRSLLAASSQDYQRVSK
jgi:hypothetical protein